MKLVRAFFWSEQAKQIGSFKVKNFSEAIGNAFFPCEKLIR